MNDSANPPSTAELKDALFARRDYATATAYLEAVAADGLRVQRHCDGVCALIGAAAATAAAVSIFWSVLGSPDPKSLAVLVAITVALLIANVAVLFWSRTATLLNLRSAHSDIAAAHRLHAPDLVGALWFPDDNRDVKSDRTGTGMVYMNASRQEVAKRFNALYDNPTEDTERAYLEAVDTDAVRRVAQRNRWGIILSALVAAVAFATWILFLFIEISIPVVVVVAIVLAELVIAILVLNFTAHSLRHRALRDALVDVKMIEHANRLGIRRPRDHSEPPAIENIS